jgi:hypothetical protein
MMLASAMNPMSAGFVYTGCLFLGMLLLIEVGRRYGAERLAKLAGAPHKGVGPIEGVVYGLLSLLIGFSFFGAAGRFDARRAGIAPEANIIATAWQRLDLLPEKVQPEFRELLRQYLDSRIKTYELLPDVEAATGELARSRRLQAAMWTRAVALARETGAPPAMGLLLPSINLMGEILTTRIEAMKYHPPFPIFLLLGLFALMAAFLSGYGMAVDKARSLLHIVGFAAAVSITLFIIFNMEYPRLGIIRLDSADVVLSELRQRMN